MDARLVGNVKPVFKNAPYHRMGGAPFGPFKHQVLAVASATPRSFPKSHIDSSVDHDLDRERATVCESGRRESNPRSELGKLVFCL